MAPLVAPGSKVLVTGANGFIAIYVVQRLLQDGYSVRGTVRNTSKGEHLKKVFAEYGDKLELVVVGDFTKPGAFDEALKGVDAVQHTASPATFDVDAPSDMIDPAVQGTVGVLKSAANSSTIRSIVITSSIVAVSHNSDKGELDETHWNTISPGKVKDMKAGELSFPDKSELYSASKTLAEQAAWEFYEKNKDTIKWSLATILPSMTFGPILQECESPDKINASMSFLYNVIWRGIPRDALPIKEFSWVHVRDIALAHVRAMERPEASGKRFLASTAFANWDYWTEVKKGTTPAPIVPGPESLVYNNSRLKNILGVQPIDAATTMKDIIADFKSKGWVSE